MQQEKQPEDIHTILSRFTSWAGKQGGNGPNGADEGIREVPYEEALLQLRDRRAVRPVQRPAPEMPPATDSSSAVNPASQPACQAVEPAPATMAKEAMTAAVALKPGKGSHGRGKAAGAVPAKSAGGTAAEPKRRSSRKAEPPEFRQVLVKSVQACGAAAPEDPAKVKARNVERDQRVSVRLSREEERELQQRAAGAGITVSQYMRQRALWDQPARPGKGAAMVAQGSLTPSSPQESAAAAKPSGWGEWITLLRNRFLSSPARFAERA